MKTVNLFNTVIGISFLVSLTAHARSYICSDGKQTRGRIKLSENVIEVKKPVWTCTDYVAIGYMDSQGFCSESAWVTQPVLSIEAKVGFAHETEEFFGTISLEKEKSQLFANFHANVRGAAPHPNFSYSIYFRQSDGKLTVFYSKYFQKSDPRWSTEILNCRAE